MEDKKAEISAYIHQRLTPLLAPLMEQIVRQRPADILLFVRDYADHRIQQREHQKSDTDSSEEEQQSEDDEERSVKLEMRMMQSREKKVSRQGISSEAYGMFNKKSDFVPSVIPKDSDSKQTIMELIKKSILFSNLGNQEFNIVADAMTVEYFQANQQVIKQGDDGEVLYVVGSGQFVCSKLIDGQHTQLKTYQVGDYFGELALMYTAPRAASITCKNDGILYGLDRHTFRHIVQDSANKRRSKFTDILSEVEILSEVGPYEKEQLCDILKEEFFEAGTFIVKEGDAGNKFYMIASGDLIAQKESKKVFQFKEGDYFGEIALVRDTPRQASVKCITACTVLSVDRDAFKRMFGSLTDILKRNEEKYKQYIETE